MFCTIYQLSSSITCDDNSNDLSSIIKPVSSFFSLLFPQENNNKLVAISKKAKLHFFNMTTSPNLWSNSYHKMLVFHLNITQHRLP